MATTGYEGKDASDFLLTHLEGAARKEMRMLSSEDKKDPEKILSLIEKQFGERLKSSQIINEFHKRDQKRTESLREYSHALLELTDRAIRQLPDLADGKDSLLCQRFIDGLQDKTLSRDLEKYIDEHSDTTFLD